MWSPGDGQARSLHGLGTTNTPPFTRTCLVNSGLLLPSEGLSEAKEPGLQQQILVSAVPLHGKRRLERKMLSGAEGGPRGPFCQLKKAPEAEPSGGGRGNSGLLPLIPFGRCPNFEGGGPGGGGEEPRRPALGAFGASASVRLTLWIPAGTTPKQRRFHKRKRPNRRSGARAVRLRNRGTPRVLQSLPQR